jgi:Flp pilus assembly protein CpaB
VAFTLAGVCALGAFVVVRGLAERAAMAGPSQERNVTVVVAARDVDAGATLTADDVATGSVPGPPPPGALTDAAEAVGHVAVTPFLAGETVVTTRLAEDGGTLTVSVPDGEVAVTLAIESAPDGLSAGDRVDVLATYTAARPYTSTVAEDLRVLRVQRAESGSFGAAGGGAATRVTFVTAPEVARALVGADATATLALAVRGYVSLATPSPAA